MSRRILNKRLLVACLDSASLLKNSSPISHSSSIASGNIHGKASVVGRPDVTFARQFSIIPSSWGFGNETKSSNQHDEDKELPTDISDMDQLTESAAMTGVDDLVDLAQVAEKAALESAMEGAWLPTRTLQWILESVHHGSGLSWWQSIMLTTVGIRAATFPIMLMQIKNTYRLSQARPEIEHLVAHMKEEQARGNPNATADYQQQVMRVWKKYNANPLKSMASIFVQAPLLIGFFSALRGLAAAKVPSMVEGGTLWFQDLTVADPTYALPIISAASFLLMVELNAADGMEGQTDKMRSRFKNIMRGVAVLIVPFTVDLPAGVFMYWTASNMVSLVQSSVLKIPSVKRKFGIPVLQKVATTTTSTPESIPPSTQGTVLYSQKPTKNKPKKSKTSSKKR
jgi:YidC/Oxa1 family membrane protein insertase